MHNEIQEDLDITILGDPHLGKIFKTGVPLHRLGERERLQFLQFSKNLNAVNTKTHVCLGDLFDKFRVSNEVVLATATAYEVAALLQPTVNFIVLQGNHDNSRDNEKVSSFSIFERMVSSLPNVHVLTGSPMVLDSKLFIPWTPFDTAKQAVENYLSSVTDEGEHFEAVFAHWDIDDYGNEDASHVLPAELLHSITNLVILGHYHKPSVTFRSGLKVVTWGSMQPYAHGEDLEGDFYVTHTKDTAELNLFDDVDFYKDKCLRVLLNQHEQPVAGVECLALTHKRLDLPDVEQLEVNVDEFSLQSVFKNTLNELGVSNEITTELYNKI